MAAEVQLPSPASSGARRTRKIHSKVKTGCITCKIRRKKCDETKPSCKRCTSTGRTCDGYLTPPDSLVSTPSRTSDQGVSDTHLEFNADEIQFQQPCLDQTISPETLQISLPRPPPTISPISDIEIQCFDYFRFVTGPCFGNYFDSSMLWSFTAKLAFSHPLLLKTAAAVGAAHRRFTYGISREAFEYCAISTRLYNEGFRMYRDFLRSSRPQHHRKEVIMVTSMLFTLFESFQGNMDVAVKHMAFGMKQYLNHPMRLIVSQSHQEDFELGPSVFSRLLSLLASKATSIFNRSPLPSTIFNVNDLPDIPTHFNSFLEAFDAVWAEVQCIYHAPATIWYDDTSRRKTQDAHVSRLLLWSAATAETQLAMPEPRNKLQMRASQLIRIVRSAAYLLLYLNLYVPNSSSPTTLIPSFPLPACPFDLSTFDDDDLVSSHDAKNNHLLLSSSLLHAKIRSRQELSANTSRVHLMAESMLSDESLFVYDLHSLSIDSGIGPPRSVKPGFHSSSKTRFLVKSLLESSPTSLTANESKADKSVVGGDDSIWSQLGIYALAEKLSSIEEHAVVAVVDSIIPKNMDPKWADITCFLEEGRVLLRYCRPGMVQGEKTNGNGNGLASGNVIVGTGMGLVWTQEWYQM